MTNMIFFGTKLRGRHMFFMHCGRLFSIRDSTLGLTGWTSHMHVNHFNKSLGEESIFLNLKLSSIFVICALPKANKSLFTTYSYG